MVQKHDRFSFILMEIKFRRTMMTGTKTLILYGKSLVSYLTSEIMNIHKNFFR